MRIRFTPESKEFFELFSRASSNAVDIARLGLELFERFPEDGAELIGRIKELEHTGDDLTHEVVTSSTRHSSRRSTGTTSTGSPARSTTSATPSTGRQTTSVPGA